jgi:3-hydroxyanthranilate 3,4-dioxygenase
MIPHLSTVNLRDWIDRERDSWGQRRVLWEDSDFIAFVTRGPNARSDFHIDPGDEIFHQVEGELNLHYVDAEGRRQIAVLGPGDLFLMPALVPHSPRRGPGSWTMVVERRRRPEERDIFVWFCDECGARVHEVVEFFDSPGEAVGRAYDTLRRDPSLRTCASCGTELAVPS